MADLGNPLSTLYPQPPSPSQNALAGNPMQLLPTIMELQKFNAQKQVGGALQSGITSDGKFDLPTALAAIKSLGPDAALAAPQGIQSGLDAYNKSIEGGQRAFDLSVAKNNRVLDITGPYADMSSMSDEDVNKLVPQLTANGQFSADEANQVHDFLLSQPPAARARILAAWRASRAGAGATMQPQPSIDPTTGQPGYRTTGQVAAGAAGAGPGVAGGQPIVTGLSPKDKLNYDAYIKDQQTSADAVQNLRPLVKVFPLISQMSHWQFGAGSKDAGQMASLGTFLGVAPEKWTDAQVMREEAGKYLAQYMSGPHMRSDLETQGRIAATPNPELTQPANIALIKNQIAMDRQSAAITQAYDVSHPSNDPWKRNYLAHKSSYFQTTDPQGYIANMLTPEERAKAYQLKGPARDRFLLGIKNSLAAQYFTRDDLK